MTAVASRRSRNSTSKAMFSAGRGLALILLAIGIGIVLLYVVDDGSTGPATEAADATSTTATGTTAPAEGDGGSTATTAPAAGRAPADVPVKVYNASGVAGAAGEMTDQLNERGYTNALAPGNLATRKGTAVACKAGFDGADAAALATAVGSSATVEAFPDPPPADLGDAQCIVMLGTP